MARSVKDIFGFIIENVITDNNIVDCGIVDHEIDEKYNSKIKVDKRQMKETDYKSFLHFIEIAYNTVVISDEKIPLAELSEEQYSVVCKDFAMICRDFSYEKFQRWIRNNKDRFSLYNINAENNDDKLNQIKFYREVKRIMLNVYQKTNKDSEEKVKEVQRAYETSCEIYDLLEKEAKSCYTPSDESDKYGKLSCEELELMLKDLEDNGTGNSEIRAYIDVLSEKIDIVEELLSRKEIVEREEYIIKQKMWYIERCQKVLKYKNRTRRQNGMEKESIKKHVLSNIQLDGYKYEPPYIDLISRCRREHENDLDKDIDVIIDEKIKQLQAEHFNLI